MTVKELIDEFGKYPGNADVISAWDFAALEKDDVQFNDYTYEV